MSQEQENVHKDLADTTKTKITQLSPQLRQYDHGGRNVCHHLTPIVKEN